MRLPTLVAGLLLVSLSLAASAQSDIGVSWVTPRSARPGQLVKTGVGGYLGKKPWPAMPLVLVRAARAPQPAPCPADLGVVGFCEPIMLPSRLNHGPYVRIGEAVSWHPNRLIENHASTVIVFRVPRLQPGVYDLALFCQRCIPGPRGSLIVDRQRTLRVR